MNDDAFSLYSLPHERGNNVFRVAANRNRMQQHGETSASKPNKIISDPHPHSSHQPVKVFDPDEEDWQRNLSLKERMTVMCGSEFFADVIFLAGEKEEKILAHKLLLSIGSPVFARMFGGLIAQKTKIETMMLGENVVEVVKVPDISPDAMKSVLKYIYTEDVELKIGYVFEVLYAAKKYLLDRLGDECANFLESEVNPENVCFVLSQALLYENDKLIQICKEVIELSTQEVVQSEAFKKTDEQTLDCILQMDSLQIDEWSLFEEVLKWTDKECRRQNLAPTSENKRNMLGTTFYSIRFPTMKQEEFAAYANNENCILTERECLDLFLIFTLGKAKSNQIPFNSEPRISNKMVEIFVSRFASISTRYVNPELGFDEKHSIEFTITNWARKIWLVGFGIYGTPQETQPVEIEMSIENGDQLLAQEKTLQTLSHQRAILNMINRRQRLSTTNNNEHRLNFKRPVLVHQGTSYKLNIQILSNLGNVQYYYGTNGRMKVQTRVEGSSDQLEVTFKNSSNSNLNSTTNVNYGQFSSLYFRTNS